MREYNENMQETSLAVGDTHHSDFLALSYDQATSKSGKKTTILSGYRPHITQKACYIYSMLVSGSREGHQKLGTAGLPPPRHRLGMLVIPKSNQLCF